MYKANRQTKMKQITFALLLGILTVNGAVAQTIIDQGTFGVQGDNLTWVLTSDSVLTISGSGDMENWGWSNPAWQLYQDVIRTVVIKEGVTSIGDNAFTGNTTLASVHIFNSVTTIGSRAFSGCISLTSIDIPNSVTSIGWQAFSHSGLTSINIPDNVTNIEGAAFVGCKSLTSINIGSGLTVIADSLFTHSTNLNSVSIGNNVKSIGFSAFCTTSLISITIYALTPPTLESSAFNRINTDSVILHVPAQSVELYRQTPVWQDFQIEAIEIENLANVQISETNFPCANFRAWLLMQTWGSKGYITEAEIENITSINVAWWNITDLTGIHFFSNLTFLHADGNQLTSLDVSMLSNLVELWCRNNQLTSLNVSGLTNLRYLYCRQNQLDSLDLSGLINLRWLGCASNRLTWLDVSDLINLETLYVDGNQLISLDASNLTNLHTLGAWDNQLASLNVSGLTNLVDLSVGGNQLTSLDVSGLTNLVDLSVGGNRLTSLDLSGLANLYTLESSRNQLTSLGLSGLVNLRNLWVWDNQLTSLDISDLVNLRNLSISWNQITSLDMSSLNNLEVLHWGGNQIISFDASALPNSIQELHLWQNQLTSLDVSGLNNLRALGVASNQLTSLNVSGTNLRELWCYNNQLTSLDLTGIIGLDTLELTGHDGNWNFRGYNQTSTLTLRGANDNYSVAVELNNPTELVSGLSYFDGTLTSTSNTISWSPFTVEAIGNPNFALSGTLNLNYTTIITVDCEIIEQGTIGNLAWLLCTDGTLIIRGFGAMPDFASASTRSTRSADENIAPWAGFCDMLTSVIIEQGVTTIGNNAFAGCESLQSVSIASSVENIGSGAFAGCTGLTEIIIYAETPPTVDPSAFDGVDKSNVILYTPAASENDYNNADVWNGFNTGTIATAGKEVSTAQIFVFPNPVFGSFQIGGITENTLVKITDLNGRIVLQQVVSPNEQISVGHLSAGMYLVKVNEKIVKIVKR